MASGHLHPLTRMSNLTLEQVIVGLKIALLETNHSPGRYLSYLKKKQHFLHCPFMQNPQLDSQRLRYIKKQKH